MISGWPIISVNQDLSSLFSSSFGRSLFSYWGTMRNWNFFARFVTTTFLFLGLLGRAFLAFLIERSLDDLWLNPPVVDSDSDVKVSVNWLISSFILFRYSRLQNHSLSKRASFFSGSRYFIWTRLYRFRKAFFADTFALFFSRQLLQRSAEDNGAIIET